MVSVLRSWLIASQDLKMKRFKDDAGTVDA